MTTNPNEFTVDAVLADSVDVAAGKLYVQGAGWNMIGTPSFPFIQPRIGIGLVVGVPYVATNHNHSMLIAFEDEDGPRALGQAFDPENGPQDIDSIPSQFIVGRPPILQPGDRQNVPFAMNFNQMRFDKPGTFTFVISIDGGEINRLTFRVTGPPGVTITR